MSADLPFSDNASQKLSQQQGKNDYNNEKSDNKAKIVFQTHRFEFFVSRAEFVKHSSILERLNLTKNLYSFDLHKYDLHAVVFFVDYIQGHEDDKKLLTYNAMADLIELADIFELSTLYDKLKQILNVIMESSADQIVNALISVGVHLKIWRSPLGRSLLDIALGNYYKLQKASNFHKLPVYVLTEILDSCNLMASSELEIFKILQTWLKRNHNRIIYASCLLECVRYCLLNDDQRAHILTCIRKLPQGCQLEMIAKTVIGNMNNYRACVQKNHCNNPRCGLLFKENRNISFNVIPNFIDLKYLRAVALPKTGFERRLDSNIINSKECVVLQNVCKPRSIRHERRVARQQRNQEELKIIEAILCPGTMTIMPKELGLVEKFISAEKLKDLDLTANSVVSGFLNSEQPKKLCDCNEKNTKLSSSLTFAPKNDSTLDSNIKQEK